jgi:hypothetical protein
MVSSKTMLSREEKRIFDEVSYAIGDGRGHLIEDVKGVAVQKHLIPFYMKIFVEKGYYDFDGKKYTLAKSGENDFRQKRDADSRKVIPRISF